MSSATETRAPAGDRSAGEHPAADGRAPAKVVPEAKVAPEVKVVPEAKVAPEAKVVPKAKVFPPHLFDATVNLADLLGLSLEQTVEALGAGWERCPASADQEGRTWFAAGEPVQVLVGVDAEQVVVACPEEQDRGARGARPGQVTLHVLGSRPWWDPELATWLRRTVTDAQRRRRRTFRFCRYCRSLVPPEWRASPDVCRHCAARYLS